MFLTNTHFGHVSSGSIYLGGKVADNGGFRIEEDLGLSATRALLACYPEKLRGFTELDDPNYSFKCGPCSFYSGTKALAEEALRDCQGYVWRLRLPFNEQDDPNNFLSQLQQGLKHPDAIHSLSYLDECVGACLELWERRAALGVYNVVNPEPVSTHEVVQLIQRLLKPARPLQVLVYDKESPPIAERVPCPGGLLDISKLLRAGITLKSTRQALERALQKWVPQTVSAANTLA